MLYPVLSRKRSHPLTVIAALVLFSISQLGAIIDPALQMQLGNPSSASADTNNHSHFLIQRPVEALDYNDSLGIPNWASWDLTAGDIGSSGRSPDFFTDTNLPPGFYEVTTTDYTGSGFDRGHMCPSADRTDSVTDNDMVFFMSNIIPQSSVNNQGVWATFEGYCRTLAQSGNELLIICGPSGFDGSRISSGKAAIPQFTWKIAVVVPTGSGNAVSRITSATRVIALKIPNTADATNTWTHYVTSATQIQVDTGYTFFTALPSDVAATLRNKVDGQSGPAPVITSFSPASGAAQTNVTITGTNFGSASAVTFNGANALFTLDSTTQITATVPTNAVSGPVSVTTTYGTALSSNSFIFVSQSSPDLTLSSSHVGNFTQGDSAQTYTIIVTNRGNSPTVGTLTVTDTLPTGLTATAISGTGWTADLANLKCTRSDSLAAGNSFPSITLTVSVATNAPATVTNVTAVSGGGDGNPTNNIVSGITVINSSASIAADVLVGFDVSALNGGLNNFGPSPFPPTVAASNITVVGLTRGSGVSATGTSATRAWGGVAFTNSSAATAIAANQFITFSVTPGVAGKVSFSAIGRFDYRRSGTGPSNGILQYQIGSGPFTDVSVLSYTASTSAGGSIGPIELTGIAALQSVGAGTDVTFRIVNFGGTSSAGTFYIFDVANSSAPDFVVLGTVSPEVNLSPLQSWRQQWFGTTNNAGIAADTYAGTADRIPNLLKYALGLNPLVASTNPATGDIATGYLRMTAPRNTNATDVTIAAQLSGDLLNWTTNGIVIDQNTPTLFQAHDALPIASGTHHFMRLQISTP